MSSHHTGLASIAALLLTASVEPAAQGEKAARNSVPAAPSLSKMDLEFLEHQLDSPDPWKSAAAAWRLAGAGKEGLRTLDRVLITGDARARRAAVKGLLQQARYLVCSSDPETRREAIPLLRSILGSGESQAWQPAIDILSRWGSAASPAARELEHVMLSRELPAASNALALLRRFDRPLNKFAAQRFLDMLQDGNPEAREVVAVSEHGPPDLLKGHEGILIAALKSDKADFRHDVRVILKGLGIDATTGDASWDAALSELDDYFQYRLLELFHGVARHRWADVLVDALSDEELRVAACGALERFAAHDTRCVSALAKGLRHRNAEIRADSARILKELGTGAKPATEALCQALRDPDLVVRARAGQALAKIGAPAIPGLVKALTDKDVEVRRAAASILGRAGAADALDPLRRALQDSDAEVRLTAKESLRRLEGR